MSGADKAAAIREKAERLAGRSLGENGDALTEMAMERACAWCGREDIPEAMEQAGISFDAVVAIEIPDEKIVARMGGRRVCEHCGASYHIVNIPPKTEGVCDVCGGKLVQRKDDDPNTVRDRLAVYHKETEPLKGFYEARGILKTVEDQPTVAGTTQAILRELGVTE